MSNDPNEHKIEPCEEAAQRWLDYARLQWHNSITGNYGWHYALKQIPPERRAYWIEKRRTLTLAQHRNADEAKALFLLYLEPVYATKDHPWHGLRDLRTGLAFLDKKRKPKRASKDNGGCDIFEPEWYLKKIIFSCDGRRLCFEEERNYYRQSGHNGKLVYLDDQLARLSNDSERQEAIETARKHYPDSTEILEAIAAAYPEPIFCPYYIKGMIWPFFND